MTKTKYDPIANRYIEIDEETAKKLDKIKEQLEHEDKLRNKARKSKKRFIS